MWPRRAAAARRYRGGVHTEQRGDLRLLWLDPSGSLLYSSDHAADLIGTAWAEDAAAIVVPVERFAPAFFDLRTGYAGDFIQKLVNYRLSLVVLGDVKQHEAASRAFRDFVTESNRGRHVWFLTDPEALDARLTGIES